MQELLKNKNFRNNQNYVIDISRKLDYTKLIFDFGIYSYNYKRKIYIYNFLRQKRYKLNFLEGRLGYFFYSQTKQKRNKIYTYVFSFYLFLSILYIFLIFFYNQLRLFFPEIVLGGFLFFLTLIVLVPFISFISPAFHIVFRIYFIIFYFIFSGLYNGTLEFSLFFLIVMVFIFLFIAFISIIYFIYKIFFKNKNNIIEYNFFKEKIKDDKIYVYVKK